MFWDRTLRLISPAGCVFADALYFHPWWLARCTLGQGAGVQFCGLLMGVWLTGRRGEGLDVIGEGRSIPPLL